MLVPGDRKPTPYSFPVHCSLFFVLHFMLSSLCPRCLLWFISVCGAKVRVSQSHFLSELFGARVV